jgi:hypothetical protein
MTVFFNHESFLYALNELSSGKAVIHQFVIPMLRNFYMTIIYQGSYSLQ